MPKLFIVQHNGNQYEVDVDSGLSVMRAVVDNSIDGIDGECNGCLNCATCHCYVEEGRISKLAEPSEMERDLLEAVIDPEPNSRLACQLTMTDELDGMVIRLPKSQY